MSEADVMQKIEKSKTRARRRLDALPVNEDPRAELRRLVLEHKASAREAVSAGNRARDRKLKDGTVIVCRLPAELVTHLKDYEKAAKAKCKELERLMTLQLRKIPIWNVLLSKMFGMGPVSGAYLCAMVDIHKATKQSNLRSYCGIAPRDNGRMERRHAGQAAHFNESLRRCLYLVMVNMLKSASRWDRTSKYLDAWRDVAYREQHSERVDLAKNRWRDPVDAEKWNGGAKAHCKSKGWMSAADLIVEDIYIVWRAIEGLPVWPDYYAAKLGYEHGGKICVREPRMLTVDEAVALVGDVGGRPGYKRVGADAEDDADATEDDLGMVDA